jgi:hypothetical protein
VRAGEGDRLAIKKLAEHDDRFFQPVDPNRGLVEGDPRSLVLGLGMARPEPEFKAPVAQQVERCRLSGEKRGVVEVVVEHHDAQAEPTAHLGRRCQGNGRCQVAPEMIGCYEHVEASVVHSLDQIDPLTPRCRPHCLEAEPEGNPLRLAATVHRYMMRVRVSKRR